MQVTCRRRWGYVYGFRSSTKETAVHVVNTLPLESAAFAWVRKTPRSGLLAERRAARTVAVTFSV